MRRSGFISAAIAFSISLLLAAYADTGAVNKTSPPKATTEQQNRMYARLRAAEQERISNYGPAIPRKAYEAIIRDLDDYQYPANLQWRAWDGYGLSLILARDRKAAIRAFQRALELGATAGDEYARRSRENLRKAEAMN
jgi:hypothetical protein